jgi:hypothetical protein
MVHVPLGYVHKDLALSSFIVVVSCLTLVLEGLPKFNDIATRFHSLTQSSMFVLNLWKVILTILFRCYSKEWS